MKIRAGLFVSVGKGNKKGGAVPKIDEISLVFLVALAIVVASFYDSSTNPATLEAEKITESILNSPSFVIGRATLDDSHIKKIEKMDYFELKTYLNAKRDFCLYMQYENGTIIFSKGSENQNQDGIICR